MLSAINATPWNANGSRKIMGNDDNLKLKLLFNSNYTLNIETGSSERWIRHLHQTLHEIASHKIGIS